MIEKTPRARGMSEKELRARIDRVIAEEERTYGRLIELRDLLHAITGELESPDGQLAEHLEHCCYAIAVSPEQAMITPLRAAFLRARSCTQPIASPAVRSAATSASSRALSRRTWVFSHAAMVKSRRANSRRLAASSDFSG